MPNIDQIAQLLSECSTEELTAVYHVLREKGLTIHHEYWTDDLQTCIDWFRSGDKKTIPINDT